MLTAQAFDDYAEVIDHAESGRRVAPCMMQAADRLKAARRLAADHPAQGIERRTADRAGRFEDAGKARRIAVVEQADTQLRATNHAIDIGLGMKAHQLLGAGNPRR